MIQLVFGVAEAVVPAAEAVQRAKSRYAAVAAIWGHALALFLFDLIKVPWGSIEEEGSPSCDKYVPAIYHQEHNICECSLPWHNDNSTGLAMVAVEALDSLR